LRNNRVGSIETGSFSTSDKINIEIKTQHKNKKIQNLKKEKEQYDLNKIKQNIHDMDCTRVCVCV
jgi:hypothetical protein